MSPTSSRSRLRAEASCSAVRPRPNSRAIPSPSTTWTAGRPEASRPPRWLGGRFLHARVGEPFAAGIQRQGVHLGGQLRDLRCRGIGGSGAFGRPVGASGSGWLTIEVDFAAGQGAGRRRRGRRPADVRCRPRPPAVRLLNTSSVAPVGENDDVVRVARALASAGTCR